MPDDKTTARGLTLDQICALVGTSRASAERAIARLIERGLIRKVEGEESVKQS
jgi:predicted transcriptional regulator